MRHVLKYLLTALVVGLSACSGSNFEGKGRVYSDGQKSKPRKNTGGTRSSESADLQNKPADNDKPGDNDEGVPGYLTSPDAMDVVLDHDVMTVTGKAGAVAADGGDTSRVKVSLWSISATRASSVIGPGLLSAERIGVAEVAADGSFRVSSTVEVDGPVVLSTASDPGGTRLDITVSGTGEPAQGIWAPGDDKFRLFLPSEIPLPAAASVAFSFDPKPLRVGNNFFPDTTPCIAKIRAADENAKGFTFSFVVVQKTSVSASIRACGIESTYNLFELRTGDTKVASAKSARKTGEQEIIIGPTMLDPGTYQVHIESLIYNKTTGDRDDFALMDVSITAERADLVRGILKAIP